MIFKLFKDIFGQKNEQIIPILSQPAKMSKDARIIDVSSAQHVVLPQVAIMREYQENYVQRDQSYWDSYNLAFSHYKRGWYEKAADEFLKIYDQNHDASYHTYLLRTYRKIINAKLGKKKFHEALTFSDELFERCKNFTNIDIKTHNKLIDLLGISIQKKELLEAVEDEPEFSIKGDMYISVSEGKKPRGFKIENPYGEINPYRVEHARQTLWPLLPHIQLAGDTVSYVENPSFTRTEGVAYRLRTVPGNSESFVYSTENVELRLSKSNLQIDQSLDCTKIAGDKYHLRCVDMAQDLSLVIFTVADECFLLDKNLKKIRKWRVPYKIDTASSRYARRNFNNSDSPEDEDVRWALETLGITKSNPSTEDVKTAFREMTKKYHPDRSDDLEAEEVTKEIIRAYEYIRANGLDGVDGNDLEDEYWVEIISRHEITGFGGFSVQLEMSMYVDPCDWIYGSGVSGDGSRIYLGCYSGKIYEISQNGVASTIYEMTTQESANVICEDGDFLHVLTFSQLYIIDRMNKKFVKTIQTRGKSLSAKGTIRFFKGGFIHILDRSVIVYDSAGIQLCEINFESAPKYVFLSPEGKLVVETGKKLHLFAKR